MAKQLLTKQLLLDNNVWVELDENNQPVIYQHYISRRDKKEVEVKRNYQIIKAKHKYGEDRIYYGVSLHLGQFYNVPDEKYIITSDARLYPLHKVVYTWFKGDIPDGFDVDHIDNDPFNNNPDNLQLLSRKDNLAKRTGCKNQHEVSLYNEFGDEYFELRDEWHKANTGWRYITFRDWYYGRR